MHHCQEIRLVNIRVRTHLDRANMGDESQKLVTHLPKMRNFYKTMSKPSYVI
jgi:hypothetical protein